MFDDADAAAHWWGIAEGDLTGAYQFAAARTVAPRLAASLAQQAGEKALKSVVASEGAEPPRTHDLVALAAMLRDAPEIQVRGNDLRRLTEAAVRTRYPDLDEIEYEWPGVYDLIGLASSLLDQVRTILIKGGVALKSPEQGWFWTERWQAMEREADKDVRPGRVTSVDGPGASFEHLDASLDDQKPE